MYVHTCKYIQLLFNYGEYNLYSQLAKHFTGSMDSNMECSVSSFLML